MNSNHKRPENRTDEELVAIWQRDQHSVEGHRALAQLLKRYQQPVYGWCWRFVHEREMALDLAQEVLVSVANGLAGFSGRSAVKSWVFSIMLNRCRSELRKFKPDLERVEVLSLVKDLGPTPDQEYEDREAEDALRHSIVECLTVLEQDALWLRCIDGLPVDEITRILGITEQSGARAVLQRARRRLRATLDEREETP